MSEDKPAAITVLLATSNTESAILLKLVKANAVMLYRFVDAHYQLVPYFLTTGSEALETNTSSITPLAKHDNFINKVRPSLHVSAVSVSWEFWKVCSLVVG